MQLHWCSLSFVPVVCECWHRSAVSWSKVQQFDPVEKVVRQPIPTSSSGHQKRPPSAQICWFAPKKKRTHFCFLCLISDDNNFLFSFHIITKMAVFIAHYCISIQTILSLLIRWYRKCIHLHNDSLLLSGVTPVSHYDSLTGSLWLKDLPYLSPAVWLPRAYELTQVTRAYNQTGVMHQYNTPFAIKWVPFAHFRDSACLEAIPNWASPLFSLRPCMRLLLISLKSREMASPSVSFVSRLQFFFFCLGSKWKGMRL